MWVSLIILFHERLKGSLEGSGCPHPHRRHPFHPRCLLTHHLSLEPSYPLYILDSSPLHGFSRSNTRFLKRDPSLLSRAVVHSGKNLPVVFSPVGSVGLRKGRKICKGFGGMWPLAPPAPSPPTGRQLPVLRARHLLPKNEKIWLFLPGAAWRRRMEDPGTSKMFIHGNSISKETQSESPKH